MIKIENTDVYGFEASIRGMRSPMNSWDKSDSGYKPVIFPPCNDTRIEFVIGENDLKLMKSLAKAGSDHGKFLRMINVTMDVTAPLYWWKEADTYRVGKEQNSCSTMHKIHAKKFTLDDFSHEHLRYNYLAFMEKMIIMLNDARVQYLHAEKLDEKSFWWQMIQLLPSSYNQRRTVQLNYEVLRNMYHARKNHKLDEWRDFCAWCETLPYFKEICLGDSE